MKKLKIAYVSNTDFNLYFFRRTWMIQLLKEGHAVYAIIPQGDFTQRLEEIGVKVIPYSLNRRSLNPFHGLSSLIELFNVFKREKFDLIHTFTLKPVFLGALAARWAGVPSVITHVTGLGHLFTSRKFFSVRWLLRVVSYLIYQTAFRYSSEVIFQNSDDMRVFGLSKPFGKFHLVRGSGVDTEVFCKDQVLPGEIQKIRSEIGAGKDSILITTIARLTIDKGVREFVRIAELLSEKYPQVLFAIVGWRDAGNPGTVEESFVKAIKGRSYIRLLGFRDDVREILAASDIYTLLSYREGLPMSVLEAAAMGKPVVVTDVPGCRETVRPGWNGLLVPARDTDQTEKAFEKLIRDPSLCSVMGRHSRELVEREFSKEIVIKGILQIYRKAVQSKKKTDFIS